MKIVGCDLHTRYQQAAMLDRETGELIERRLEHASGEARALVAMSKKQKQHQKQNPQRRESQKQNLRYSRCLLTTPTRLSHQPERNSVTSTCLQSGS